ncbi:MAG: hypothetical protein HFI38_09345 [Lachnospiraceae bacterium]|jgi:sporulation integral membrane protein YlbJ|nr:hypothetical protein [Lachnospiraceae bacterium]
MKTKVIRISAIFCFLLMLLNPADTLKGAAAGLLLWFQTVLPTLLPCMIGADYLIRIGADRYISRMAVRPLALMFGVSPSGAYALLTGFLCGYPMGAKTSASLLFEGKISKREASYLLSFCNQPSPMFLTGFLCLSLLSGQGGRLLIGPMLAGVYGSAVFVSFVYRALRRMNRHMRRLYASGPEEADSVRSSPVAQKTTGSSPLALLEISMMTSFEVMVKIGGYMMLFSVLEVFIEKLSLPGQAVESLLAGFVEMTTGNRRIASALPLPWSVAACCGIAAFGGLSGFAQTANILNGSGLSCERYFLWKLLQGFLAAVIALIWCILAGIALPW